jgi:hypothetical protein
MELWSYMIVKKWRHPTAAVYKLQLHFQVLRTHRVDRRNFWNTKVVSCTWRCYRVTKYIYHSYVEYTSSFNLIEQSVYMDWSCAWEQYVHIHQIKYSEKKTEIEKPRNARYKRWTRSLCIGLVSRGRSDKWYSDLVYQLESCRLI